METLNWTCCPPTEQRNMLISTLFYQFCFFGSWTSGLELQVKAKTKQVPATAGGNDIWNLFSRFFKLNADVPASNIFHFCPESCWFNWNEIRHWQMSEWVSDTGRHLGLCGFKTVCYLQPSVCRGSWNSITSAKTTVDEQITVD